MKTIKLMFAVGVLCASETFGATSVSVLSVRQRWPVSDVIDIDFSVSGEKTDVDFFATWEGQSDPVFLCSAFCVEPQQLGHVSYDPAVCSAIRGKSLPGFTVTASVPGADAHKYLVLDLVNGGYSYHAAPPAGGWTAEHKSKKMVFARVPAGTYKCGLDDDVMEQKFGIADTTSYRKWWKKRNVTFTSDYYMGIFILTEAQYSQVQDGTASTNYKSRNVSYYKMRGSTNSTDNVDNSVINWPTTKYRVAQDSFVDKLRKLAGGDLRIDLPEEEQWEAAMRGPVTTIWPNGGDINNTVSELSNICNQVCAWYGSCGGTKPDVGSLQPNNFGIYDPGAYSSQWTLDCTAWNNSTKRNFPYSGKRDSVDPVGTERADMSVSYMYRVVRSSGSYRESAVLRDMTPASRAIGDPNQAVSTARFCIHLKELDWNVSGN